MGFGGFVDFWRLVSEISRETPKRGEKMAEIPKYNGKSALQCGAVRILLVYDGEQLLDGGDFVWVFVVSDD